VTEQASPLSIIQNFLPLKYPLLKWKMRLLFGCAVCTVVN